MDDAKATGDSLTPGLVEVEVIDDLVLGARESRTVSTAVCLYATSLLGPTDPDSDQVLETGIPCRDPYQVRVPLTLVCHRVFGYPWTTAARHPTSTTE